MSRAFIIGSTGIIGFNIAVQLAQKGWTVYGLARSPEKAQLLTKNEIIPVLATIKDTDTWVKVASSCDVIVEAMADYADYSSPEIAKEQLLKILAAHPNKVVIYTSGVWVHGSSTERIDENTPLNPIAIVQGRPKSEEAYLKAGATVVRPACVYGGSGSLIALLANKFKGDGKTVPTEVVLPGTGEHAWCSVHAFDLADAYVRIAESGPRHKGQVFNLSSGQIHIGQAARALAKLVGYTGTIKFAPPGGDPFGQALALNQNVSMQKAQSLLGWNPRQAQFLDATEKYFNTMRAHGSV